MNKLISIGPDEQSVSHTRLCGVWLLLARVVWVALALPILALAASSLPQYVAQLKTPCSGSGWDCEQGQLTSENLAALQEYGLSLDIYVAIVVASAAILTLIWFAVAAFIAWRKSDDWMALLVALMLIGLGVFITISPVNPIAPPWDVVAGITTIAAFLLLLLVFTLFPDGRFVPRWTRWLPLTYVSLFALSLIGDADLSWRLAMLMVALLLGSVTIAQIYRYRWVSTPAQRTQTKWVVVAVSVAILVLAGQFVLLGVLTDSPGDPLVRLSISLALALVALLIPLSFAIAVLRHHLFDINKLINRTLVYGTLTALLAMVYVGSVFALQTLLHSVTNQTSSIAIVVATLATAALVQPLRLRVQRGIDRRFYRRKYDAERTLRAFSAALRSKVDLEDLGRELLSVVRQTMQPTHVSLWLTPLRQGWDGEPHPLRQEAQILPVAPLAEQDGSGQLAFVKGAPGMSLRIWGGAICFLAGALWIAYSIFSLIVQPQYWDPVSGLDYLSVALYSGALLSLAGGLVVLYVYVRRIGRAHWVGTLGLILAIAGATLAGVGNLLEDRFGVSVMGWIAYVPGILALLAGLLVASIAMLVTRTLPAIYGVIFLLGAVALPFLTSGGGIVLGASWLALGVFFLTSADGQPDLSIVRRPA